MREINPARNMRPALGEFRVALAIALLVAGVTRAQMSPFPSEHVPLSRTSGVHANISDAYHSAYATVVQVDETAAWTRLHFADAHLDGDSFIRVTSAADGKSQHLRAKHLDQWRLSSAYFNGSAVTVELVTAPATSGNFLRIASVVLGLSPAAPTLLTQCGDTDDRIPSDEPSIGRLAPAGCTATIYNASSCMVTAGHCLGSNDAVEFNVPLSLPGGAVQHPGPEDQYAVDSASEAGTASGIGNDWGHFRVFANTETGMLPHEAQQALSPLASEMPPLPVDIQIIGYGVDTGAANQTQQISFGPVLDFDGSVSHRADTQGGNSGSSIVDIATERTIGIHTHGGCGSSPDSTNEGTLITIAALQLEVLTCLGIGFQYPLGLIDLVSPQEGALLQVQVTSVDDPPDPETATLLTSVDGGPTSSTPMIHLGDDLFEALISPAPCGSVVAYFVSLDTLGGHTATDPLGAPAESHQAFGGQALDTIVDEDFQTAAGYQVSGDASDGQWQVGVPVGGGDRGDPPTDFDGSGSCFLTDNTDGNSDVDGGSTILTSPIFDVSGEGIPMLSYARWYSNDTGAAPESDVFVVELSDNGGDDWVNIETVGPTGPGVHGGWISAVFDTSQILKSRDQMRVRFTASDEDPGSVVEAAIDALSIVLVHCDDQTPPAVLHSDDSATRPFSGYVDPRAESSDGESLDLGIETLVVEFTEQVRAVGGGDLTPQAFTVSSTGDTHPAVVQVDATENPLVALTLSAPIPLQHWTTIVANVEDLAGNRITIAGNQGPGIDEADRVDIGFLPCDIDQSGGVQPFDLLRFRQFINGLIEPAQGEDRDFVDIDRDNEVTPFDLLALRQLIQGTGNATLPWDGQSLPDRP